MANQIELVQGSDKWKQLRKRSREDLFWFAGKVLGLEDKIPMTYRAHYGMCRFAERKTGIPEIDEARIQMISVPRGVGKSGLITGARTVQELIQNRNASIGIANESQDKAKGFLAQIKTQFESNEFLQLLFPECIPNFREVVWAADKIFINRSKGNSDAVNPSVVAVGAGSQTAGFHCGHWIVDDLISDDAAENALAGLRTEIDKANRWVTRLPPLLKNPARDPMTFVYTPWFLEDTYHFIEETFSYGEDPKEFDWILEHPNGDTQTIRLERRGDVAKFRLPAIDEAGRPLFPERYDLEELDKLRKADPYFYQSQYLLNPSGGSAAEFRPEWLKEFEKVNKNQIRFRNEDGRYEYANVRDLTIIMSVDPAISKSEKAARSAITIVGTDGRRQFLLEAWARRVGATDLATQILNFFFDYPGVYRIVIESVAYQQALFEVLQLVARERNVQGRLPLYEHKTGSKTKKEVRILGLEPYFRKGSFYYCPSDQHDFFNEYSNYPHVKTVDLLDALSFQKDLWERMAGKRGDTGGLIQEWRDASAKAANRVRDRFSKGRRR